MRTSEFDYDLPPELIAQHPVEPRDAARMMVLDRATGAIAHHAVRDLPQFLHTGDLMVVNNTRVIPARLRGRKPGTGGRVEVFLLEPSDGRVWEALIRSRRRPRPGDHIEIGDGASRVLLLEELGGGRARVRIESPLPVMELLQQAGETPLPPYIHRSPDDARRTMDAARYQTIYAREPGAVAAPTAGLHLTEDLLGRLAAQGVRRAEVTLHVGIGTFRPVSAEQVKDHRMESERYSIPPETITALETTRASGGRVVAVGTTTVRTLETAAAQECGLCAGDGRSTLFITPPYSFRVAQVLLTNFHLPRSTLLMLAAAFAGTDLIRKAYDAAVAEQYRFYSYGDCMLIL